MRPTPGTPLAPGARPAPGAPAPPAAGQPAPTPDDAAPRLEPGWKPHAGARVELGERKRIFVGDVFHVVVTVIAREAVAVNLPSGLDLGKFSLLKLESSDQERLDGQKVKHRFRLRVAAYSVGELTLPPIPVTYVPPREALADPPDDPAASVPALVITTPEVRQQVASVLANEPQPQLKQNAPPVTILVEDERMKIILVVILAVLVGVALGLLIYWLVRRRRRAGPPPVPARPAHEIALEKLARLRQAGYLERGEFKPFYFEVSEAIREYLGNRYGFDSLEMTTTELADALRAVPLQGVSYAELMQFLSDCDLVKFAKYIPPLQDAEAILEQAERIVQDTKVLPPEPEDEDDDEGEGDDGDEEKEKDKKKSEEGDEKGGRPAGSRPARADGDEAGESRWAGGLSATASPRATAGGRPGAQGAPGSKPAEGAEGAEGEVDRE
jgi:hypothetical protein